MEKKDYINRVLLIMNEVGMTDKDGNSFIGADTTQIDRYIEGTFQDAWRRCVKVMPRSWFKSKSFNHNFFDNDEYTPTPSEDGSTGYVVLPDDFYLLVAFKMKGWHKSVYEATIENERTAGISSNEWTRGSTIRPTCVISLLPIGSNEDYDIKQVLKYFSLPKGTDTHKVEEAIYIPIPKSLKDEDDDFELPLSDQVIEPMAYLSAATVFTQFEKYDLATQLEARSVEMFPGLQMMRGQSIITKQ